MNCSRCECCLKCCDWVVDLGGNDYRCGKLVPCDCDVSEYCLGRKIMVFYVPSWERDIPVQGDLFEVLDHEKETAC